MIDDPLTKRLIDAQVASCTCQTKTPDPDYHAPLCHYRLFTEAADYIMHLESCSTSEIYAEQLTNLKDALAVTEQLLRNGDVAIKEQAARIALLESTR